MMPKGSESQINKKSRTDLLVDPCPQNSITEVTLAKMQCIILFSFYNTSSVSKRSQLLNLIQKLSSVSTHFDECQLLNIDSAKAKDCNN